MTSGTGTRQMPIAVVGLGALMPGSVDLDGFWRNVISGLDLMIDVPASRWLIEDYYDPDPQAIDKTYGRRGAFLPQVEFDPIRYGIPPNALSATDSSQLLALLVADQVLADCAVGLPGDRERVSVLLGASGLQLMLEASARLHRPMWLRALREHGVAEPDAQAICDRIADSFVPWREETFPGLLTNVVAGRIANRFDLHGANHTTDAACASSIAALYAAVADLSLSRSDLVITGGVDTMNDITMYTCFSRTPALSPTGDCRPFSDTADGTMLGEGLAMFALKRLADAERDGDQVYAVIRGVGAASDGRGTAIYAPLPEGQVRALQRAYEAAGYGPETVELVEAHGTGTAAGDAAEFSALRRVFNDSGRPDRQWCALGSVKSQIGHTKSAAGAAGLLKAVLAVHTKVLPPTIKVDRPNPALELDTSPFYLNTKARPWVGRVGHPRRASVSSFGFGGTNFHVTLEEYVRPAGSVARPARRLPANPTELVLFSAESPEALLARIRELAHGSPPAHGSALAGGGQLAGGGSLAELARETQMSFRHDDYARLGVVARDPADLSAKLRAAAAWIEGGNPPPASAMTHYATGAALGGQVGYLFPGQGAQYVGMGADLAVHLPLARSAWDRAAGLDLADAPLDRVVFPPPAFASDERAAQEARLTATEWAQPALAAHSLALLDVLDALGLRPDCVAGHSLGELTALHAAGAYDADTLVRLVRRRGELMRDASTASGGMLAVSATRERTESVIAGLPDVWLANHNAPRQVVLAGTGKALETAAERLARERIGIVPLKIATAFHSPLVAAASGPFMEFLSGVRVSAPAIDVYAGSNARPYPADPDGVRAQLAAQLTVPVHFIGVIEEMYARGVRTFIEVGSGTTLTGLVGQILGQRPYVGISLDHRERHGLTSLQNGLSQIAVHGLAMNFEALWDGVSPNGSARAKAPSKAVVLIDGGNYARPYPVLPGAPAPSPSTVPALPPASAIPPAPAIPRASVNTAAAAMPQPSANRAAAANPPAPASLAGPAGPAAAAVDGSWLRAIEAAQQQTAEAHGAFQRAMADAHIAYLRMAETTLAGMLAAAGGPTPSAPAQPPVPAVSGPPTTAPIHTEQPTTAPVLVQPPTMRPEPPATTPVPPRPSTMDTGDPGAAPVSPNGELAAGTVARQADSRKMDTEDIGSLLLSVVADRTGYPVEILSLDMELDTDLGIDSIKKVEILSAVRERIGDLPAGELPALAGMRTLRAIVQGVSQPAQPETGARATTPPTPATRPADPAAPPEEIGQVGRWAVRAVATRRSGLAVLGLTDFPLAVTDDGTGVAAQVVAHLARQGIRAGVVTNVPPDAGGLLILDGLRPVASIDEAVRVQRAAFRAARRIAGRMQATGGIFVTVQDTGGDFGLPGASTVEYRRAWLGGLAALARTAATEWPRAAVKAIDCQAGGRTPADIAAAIVDELLGGGGSTTVGLKADGTRVTVDLVASPPVQGLPRIGPHSVIVATGGARGVTASVLRLLASERLPRLVLLGRTPLSTEPEGLPAATDEAALVRLLAARQPRPPAEVTAEARRILAGREVRQTLAELEQSGAKVRYAALDVRDAATLSQLLDDVRRDWGPITGIIHGAGVLADSLIADKTDDQFAAVFDTKVEGLRTLLTATASDPLDLLCVFSSVAVFGNPGQCDYAMANAVLNQVMSAEQARRPGCVVRAIGWGPWQGGMVGPEQAGRFHRAGVPLIDLDAGARAFLAEIDTTSPDVQVVLSATGPSNVPMQPGGGAAQVTVVDPAYGYLADHEIGGVPVVPMATVLDWFVGAAHAWQPARGEIVIRDLRVLDKISLPSLHGTGHRLILRGEPSIAEDGPVLDLDLRDEAGRPHYRGSVASGPPPAPGAWHALADLRPVSRPYDGTTLFHGPRFQAIRGAARVGPQGAECAVVGSRALGWEGSSRQTDPATVDGCLQLAVLWAREAGAGNTLPMAIRECRIYRPGPVEAEIRCVVRARANPDDTRAECDVALIDPDGSPRVELVGVQLIRRPG